MPKIVSISPFPPGIDRDRFGDWLSGFTDGEGHFALRRYHEVCRGRDRIHLGAAFKLRLRADDRDALELIRSFLGCGTIRYVENRTESSYPAFDFEVIRIRDLAKRLVPNFDKYPLRAKKARDFSLWKEGVLLLYRVSRRPVRSLRGRGTEVKWTLEEREHFKLLDAGLRKLRQFDSRHKLVSPRQERHERELFD